MTGTQLVYTGVYKVPQNLIIGPLPKKTKQSQFHIVGPLSEILVALMPRKPGENKCTFLRVTTRARVGVTSPEIRFPV